MRFVLLSDTHLRPVDVPSADVLIHAGDFTMDGTFTEVSRFNAWLAGVETRERIIIAGNHDRVLQSKSRRARALLSDCTYLKDNDVEIGGMRIYGSPWQPWFYDWAFNFPKADDGRFARAVWEKIPLDTDILVTHGPPHGILDQVGANTPHLGCSALRDRVRIVRPKLHVFGHIHGGYGTFRDGSTLFVNASICNESYDATNAPILIEIKNGKVTLL